ALLASRRDAASVFMRDFEDAKDKVMMGVERKSMLISDAEKRNTAYHEAGHVLVSKLVPGSDPVHKVTIIPRGRALGLTHFLPIDEKHNYSKSFLETTLVNLLGGRVAELIVMNELTTGAGNDIERATELARKMVCEWGMSEKLGPLTYGAKEEEIFLGREITRRRNYSESTAIQIDSEIKYIVSRAEKRADKFVRDNIVKLHALAEALLERELLDGHEIDLIMKGKILPPLKKQASVKSPPKMKRPASKTKRRPTESASGTSIPKPIVIESKPTVPEPKTEVSEPKSEEKKSTQKRHSTSRSRKRKRPGAGGGTQPVKPAAVQPVKSVEDSKKPVDKLKSESPEKPAAEVRTEISGAPKSGKTEHPGISKTYKINKTQYDKIKDKISGGQRKSDDTSGRTDNLIKAEDKSNQAVKANDTAKKTKTEDPKLFSDEIEKKPRRVFSEPAYKKETEISAEQKKDVKLDSSGPPPSSTLRRQTSVPTKSRPVIDKKTPVKPAVFETPEWLKNINHRKDGKKQEKFSLESAKIQSASSDKPPSESPGILNDRGDNQQDNKDAV
ncbi:MAG: hypothetical protein H8E87_06500, partial [FCB group bacterium]|nr:hypothetical protein [FCB group bacterium]